MQIPGNFSVSGVDAARTVGRSNSQAQPTAEPAAKSAIPIDQLDLSPEALGTANVNSTSETFRPDKVASMKQAIANGDYDTDEKMSIAFGKMLDQLG